MRANRLKILGILLSYVIVVVSYPFMRFNNNWRNSDFPHQVPNLAPVIESNLIFDAAGSSTTILWYSNTVITHHVTNLNTGDIYRYAFPFTLGIIAFIILVNFSRKIGGGKQWVAAAVAFSIINILISRMIMGKHSPFTFTLFFLILTLAVTEPSRRERFILVLLISSVVLYHVWISAVLLSFIFLYILFKYIAGVWIRSTSPSSDCRDLVNNFLLLGLVWGTSHLIASTTGGTVFANLLPYIFGRRGVSLISQIPGLGDASNSGISETTTAGSISGRRATSGFQQYFDLLFQRWDPWWIWIVLSIPLILILLIAGIMWLKHSTKLIRRKSVNDGYLLATVGGIFMLSIFLLSIKGFSASNLMMRYLPYFVPLAVVFVLSTSIMKIFTNRRMGQLLLVAIVILGTVTTPIYVSNEPAIQEVQFGSYSEYEQNAIVFSYFHAKSAVMVAKGIPFVDIVYIEVQNYTEPEQLPFQRLQEPDHCLTVKKSQPTSRENKIYDNRRVFIQC